MRQLIYSLAVVLTLSSQAAAQNVAKLYVPNQGGSTIIDYTVNNNGTLTTGTGFSAGVFSPFAVAVTPDQRWAYATLAVTDEVIVIDTAAAPPAVVQTVASGSGTRGLAVSPDGLKLWVANRSGDSISTYTIDPATGLLTSSGAAIASSLSGSLPHGLAFSPGGATVYVANEAGSVDVIDVGSRTIVATIPLEGGALKDVAFHPTLNRVFVSDGNLGVRVFDTTTNLQIDMLSIGIVNAEGLAVTPDGKWLYVASFGNGAVVSYDAATLAFLASSLGLSNPVGVAVRPDSSAIYVTNSLSNNVSMFSVNTTTGALTSLGTAATGPSPQYPGMCRTSSGTFAAGANFTATLASYDCISPNSTFTGGTLTMAASLGIPAHMVISTGGMNISTANFATTLSGGLSGPGPLTITGTASGAVDINVTNTNTGPTTVTGSSLRVLAPASTSASSAITIQGGGLLAGDGTFGGPVAINASFVRPGVSSTGILTVGNLSLPAGSTLVIRLNGATAGTEHDRLDVNGTVTLGGTLVPFLGFVPAGGQVFTILQNDGADAIAGVFTSLPEGSTINMSGGLYRISYVGGTGNDVTLTRLVFPAVTTVASAATTVGGAVSATATINGGSSPTGTLTFRLYGPSDTTCAGTPFFTETRSMPGPGVYTSSLATVTAAGTYRWVATYNGDTLNGPTGNECNIPGTTVAVSKGSQTITFGGLGGKTLADAAFPVSATASSGLTVAFTSTTSAVCTVSAATVTLVAAGTCTIAADQAGDASYEAATRVTQSFLVASGCAVSIAPAQLGVGLTGIPYSQTLTLTNGAAPVTFSLNGTLPAGVTFTNGVFSGPPAARGAYDVTVTGTDANGCQSTASYSLAVSTERRLIVATDAGAPGAVRALNIASGAPRASFAPFGAFAGGVSVAQGDTNGDGAPDTLTGAGPGGEPLVNVFDGSSGQLRLSFLAFDPSFRGGVEVAAGDVTGDGLPDILAVAGCASAFQVRAFNGVTGALVRDYPFAPSVWGCGLHVAAGDVNGDGTADLVVGSGGIGPSFVGVIDGASGVLVREMFPFGETFTGGVYVAAGDVNGDGFADLVTGAGSGGSPSVRVFDGTTGAQISGPLGSFAAYTAAFAGGVRVAAGDLNGDGRAEVITGAGPNGGPHVRVWDGASGTEIYGLYAFDPTFSGGVFVAGPVSSARMNVDIPAARTTGTGVRVAGWALRELATDTVGVDAIHAWAYPVAGGAPIFVGAAPSRTARPDVAAAFGGEFLMSGFDFTGTLAAGTYDLIVYARNSRTLRFDQARVVRITVQ